MLPKLLFARLLIVVLLLLWLARVTVTRTLVVKRTPLDVPLLLFLASAALSTVLAENQNVAVFGTYARYDGLLTLLTYAGLYWLAAQSLAGKEDALALVRVVLASGYVVAAVAIVQSLHDSIHQGGIAPAFGSMGNANVLGAFLALVATIAAAEFLATTSVAARILLGNVLLVSALALLLSVSRSSWLGTAVGLAAALLAARRLPRASLVIAPAGLLAAALLIAALATFAPGSLERAVADRFLVTLNPQALEHTRLGIWGDSLRLIAARPLAGYGPDNVGLVFPRFQTGDWGLTYSGATGQIRQPIDKAHAELLQVGATQGLVGVATYLLVLAAFLRTVWRARASDHVIAAGAGWIAYQVVVQLNFTALAAALPVWVFVAAAVVLSGGVREQVLPRAVYLWLAPGVVLAGAIAWWGLVLPYAADTRLRQAVDADYAGDARDAQAAAGDAHRLAPWESVYAVEVGNVAFERGDWQAARNAYRQAASLGTFNPLVYRNLAIADRNLGLTAEGREAAVHAWMLDRFDVANQALMAEFGVNSP